MPTQEPDLQDAKALVIDGNPQSRSIIVSQLREAGVGTVVQCSRLVDARNKLEMGTFDVVISEQYFVSEDTIGLRFCTSQALTQSQVFAEVSRSDCITVSAARTTAFSSPTKLPGHPAMR